jgi:hypothetical protein
MREEKKKKRLPNDGRHSESGLRIFHGVEGLVHPMFILVNFVI